MARPRDPSVEQRALDVAAEIAERDGLDALTISAVAEAAGVSRPALYRRWPSRAALQFEIQLRSTVPGELPDLGSFRAELRLALAHLCRVLRSFERQVHGEQLAAMVSDRSFAEQVWSRRWLPDREAVLVVWDRAVGRGEVDPEVDGADVVNDAVAAVVFRVLLWHAADDSWVDGLVDRICDGVVIGPARRPEGGRS